MLVTITNDFHNTSARVRVGEMTLANAKKVADKLCGVNGCTCGNGPLSTRGPQRTEDGQQIEIGQRMSDGPVFVDLYTPDAMCSDAELAERSTPTM